MRPNKLYRVGKDQLGPLKDLRAYSCGPYEKLDGLRKIRLGRTAERERDDLRSCLDCEEVLGVYTFCVPGCNDIKISYKSRL